MYKYWQCTREIHPALFGKAKLVSDNPTRFYYGIIALPFELKMSECTDYGLYPYSEESHEEQDVIERLYNLETGG
jgi:hypothetical protein